jgi:hypothetical protein
VATNLALDDELIEEVRRLGGHRTKRAAVTAALEEYVQKRQRESVIELFGTIDVDPDYDYKKQRKKK